MKEKKIISEKDEVYERLIKKHSPKSPILKNSSLAFITGGAICFVGEWLAYLYRYLGADEENSYLFVTVSYILLASVATALGFFDNLSNYLYAGVLVPVTGFSNSVTSAALDTREEGYISGVGSKIFTVAGPVILFSALSGTLYGFIYFLVSLFLK